VQHHATTNVTNVRPSRDLLREIYPRPFVWGEAHKAQYRFETIPVRTSSVADLNTMLKVIEDSHGHLA